MCPLLLLAAPAAVAAALAFPGQTLAQTGTLRVVRVTPTVDAGPMQTINISFDRPVAGSLDHAVARSCATKLAALASSLALAQ